MKPEMVTIRSLRDVLPRPPGRHVSIPKLDAKEEITWAKGVEVTMEAIGLPEPEPLDLRPDVTYKYVDPKFFEWLAKEDEKRKARSASCRALMVAERGG